VHRLDWPQRDGIARRHYCRQLGHAMLYGWQEDLLRERRGMILKICR
jgi:hypothetical protein